MVKTLSSSAGMPIGFTAPHTVVFPGARIPPTCSRLKKKKKSLGQNYLLILQSLPKRSWEQTFLEASSNSISLDKSTQIYFHNQGNDDKKKWQPVNLKQKQCL